MAEIIEFGRKFQDVKCARDEVTRQRKVDALRRVFQCTRCVLKCAKCGTQLDMKAGAQAKKVTPYPFCKNCSEEYSEYKARVAKEQPQPSHYWHNDAWMKVWESWLDHQKRLDEYRKSREFLRLLQEVEDLLGGSH
jgi:hypothetical protein